jgi:CheY-like chemotaxis protein/HPt (histidine-containing phosphotransfer) domain-containing protein
MDESIPTTDGRTMKPRIPRILLVEDDPVSRAFLAVALGALPAEVDAAASAAEALACAGDGIGHDLWLVDAHLPDADGPGLLASLRERAAWTPAIAHTAAPDAATAEALRAAGFAGVLRKPISAGALRAAARRALRPAAAVADPGSEPPGWDDAVALAALRNDGTHVEALRGLFLGELPGQRDAVVMALAVGDRANAAAVLHRLRASCGFVGAVRLEMAAWTLQHEPGSADALQHFVEAIDVLLP